MYVTKDYTNVQMPFTQSCYLDFLHKVVWYTTCYKGFTTTWCWVKLKAMRYEKSRQ